MPRLLVLNAAGVALLAVSWLTGLFQIVVLGDKTFITPGILVMAAVGVGLVGWGKHALAGWVSGVLIELGLIGTIIGWMIAFLSIQPEKATDIESIIPIVAGLIHGMGTSLTTTLVGAIGSLWISINLKLANVR